MTEAEFRQYWRPARDTFGTWKGHCHNKDEKHPSKQLAAALGLDYPQLGYWQYIELTEDLKNILLLLTSPHRETLLKVYQIRKDFNEQKHRTHLHQAKQADRDAEGEAGADPNSIS